MLCGVGRCLQSGQCTSRVGVDCESARVVLEVLRGGIASRWASLRGVYLEWPVAECEPIVLQGGLWYITRVGKPYCGVYVCRAGQSVSVQVMRVVARSGHIVYAYSVRARRAAVAYYMQ